MANNFVQVGTVLAYTNKGEDGILSGDIVPFEARIGIAKTDIPVDEMGSVAVTGVWALPKSSAAFEQGQEVFYKDKQIIASKADGAVPAGYVWDSALAGDETVNVKIG